MGSSNGLTPGFWKAGGVVGAGQGAVVGPHHGADVGAAVGGRQGAAVGQGWLGGCHGALVGAHAGVVPEQATINPASPLMPAIRAARNRPEDLDIGHLQRACQAPPDESDLRPIPSCLARLASYIGPAYSCAT